MKRLSLLFVGILLSLFFFSCSEHEEETLDFNDIKTTAVIKGKASYSKGQDFVDGKYIVDNIVPAANKKVFIEVPYNVYDPNGVAVGIKVFETTTNANGEYSISFPFPASKGLTDVNVRMEEFITDRKVFVKMDNNTPIFKIEKAYLSVNTVVSVKANKLSYEPFVYANVIDQDAPMYKEFYSIKGKLEQKYEEGYLNGKFKDAANRSLDFKVTYKNGDEFTFGVLTNDAGEYEAKIPVEDAMRVNQSIQKIELVIYDYKNNEYKHYSNATDSKTLSGFYILDISYNNILDITAKLRDADNTLILKPYVMTFDNVSDNEYNEKALIGWYRDNNRFEKMTVNGYVKLPVELTSTTTGYVFAPNAEVAITISGDVLYTSTDANGKYEFQIPLTSSEKASRRPVTITNIEPSEIKNIFNFKHFETNTSTQTIDISGKYLFDQKITPNNQYDLTNNSYNWGTSFMSFTPSQHQLYWQIWTPSLSKK